MGTQGLNAASEWKSASAGTSVNNSQAGSGYWYDGSVGGHDGIAQNIATITGDTYDLSFWIGIKTIQNGISVDIQVFAGALPGSVSVTRAEPLATCPNRYRPPSSEPVCWSSPPPAASKGGFVAKSAALTGLSRPPKPRPGTAAPASPADAA